MKIFSIREAAGQLGSLIDAAARGEDVVIAQNGQAAVRLTPVLAPKRQRKSGGMKGQFQIPDDFDAPLPEHIQALFEGS